MFVHILNLKVLSESVPKGLTLLGGENVSATAHFVAIFDKFFDCFNVSHFDNGKLKRKPFQAPYRSPKDF